MRIGIISRRLAAFLVFNLLLCEPVLAGGTVRVGVLKFGTVNWELNALHHAGLDAANGFTLEIVPFAGEDATAIALMAGEVDIIVSDWLWVSRQRSSGHDLTFVPYSTSVGAVMVPEKSPIRSLGDLRGRKIGIAGGPLDKNWLLVQGLAKRDFGLDLAAENDVVFGAPPLLAKKAETGELDAVLDFWHYCARLEARGFRRLIDGNSAAGKLGASGPVAAIGYVFSESWADENPARIAGFVKASRQAKQLLGSSDAEWERLAPVIKAEGDELHVLRDRFREGIPMRPANEEEADAARIYRMLAGLGGEKLVGKGEKLADGTYWRRLGHGF